MFGYKSSLLIVVIGCVAFAIPAVFYGFFRRRVENHHSILLLIVYVVYIIYKTILFRTSGTDHQIELTPFWSYSQFSEYGVRSQIYMNIFLFIPFGFLLSWVKKWSMAKVVLTGCLFSIPIEATQYIFCLGLCEFDDVFHNTLGTAIGYWYWRGLEFITEKIRNHDST